MKFEYKSPEDLKPFVKNPYIHPEAQIRKLEKSIGRFGFIDPIICCMEYMIVAGHARHKAALNLGLESVPVIYLENMTYEEAVAYVIGNNQLARLAEEDKSLMKELLEGISADPDFDPETIGFTVKDFDKILGPSIDPEQLGTSFTLPSGEKEPFQQMTFMLADAQVDLVNKCLSASKKNMEGVETFGNENGNGNGLYRICLEWSQQKIL